MHSWASGRRSGADVRARDLSPCAMGLIGRAPIRPRLDERRGRETTSEGSVSSQLGNLIAAHGYWIVAAAIAVESMGIPAPGETALVTAAIFAGTTHRLNIGLVIIAAAAGAIAGDNIAVH